jgi:NAD+ synthase
MLGPAVAGRAADAAQATVEAGIRGATLMALADRFGWLALATADKSALAVGSAALDGDMCGGFAVLKDVYKTTLGALARWRNAERPMGLLGPAGPVIPDRLVAMPPSAERRPGATGAETLPPDAALDDILMCIVERDMALEAIVERGHAAEIVRGVSRMLDRAEHKRRQAPPGVTVSRRAFGRDRRYPITNAFDAAPPLPAAEPGETSRAGDPPPSRA